MQIRVFGFKWSMQSPLDVNRVFRRLQEQSKQSFRYSGFERTIFWATQDGLQLALVVTSKDRKARTQFDPRSRELVAQEIRSGRKDAEFNILVVNPATGHGLYSYYHGSWSLMQFEGFVEKHYRELRNELVEAEVTKAAPKSDSARQHAKRSAESSIPKMAFSPKLSEEGLKEMIESLDEVKRFEFTIPGKMAETPLVSGAGPSVKHVNYQISFTPMANESKRALRDKLANVITSTIRAKKLKRGRVVGTLADLEARLDIAKNMRIFGYDDLDKAIKQMRVGMQSFADHELCKWVVKMGVDDGWLS